ncbi:hypothetical protein IW140_004826 [Coemansia sp. RSA 1813]|nr:hypothetical protein EV178_004843 [Coemansia sp. RSA 1646]KAJ1766989.1 hypothetical protein LPJ74_005616 [Coemansia sp. RSA 1843]KAJ2088814.1 hypothetical protein IW138_003886 [Coemansia sp. RSA 986]KAJ2212356.1 hypothetical protein EV179_004751 [Coemansia sp. RSA 487]KAJ2566703.1 hypothetical protein IW140_004826 [Coemansia sp. RSA 1813]
MHSLFRRSQAVRGPTNQRSRQRLTWEERARVALAAAREVEETSGESVPTRPSEVNASRRLFYGPRYILPGTHTGTNEHRQQEQREEHQRQLQHEEPCIVLQADMALDVSTLYISSLMMESGTNDTDSVAQSPLFTLSFAINTLVPIDINLHWLATEEWDLPSSTEEANGPYPRFSSRVNVSRSYSIDAGLGQKFALPKSDWLDPSEEPYRTLSSSDWQARLTSLGQASHSSIPMHQPTSTAETPAMVGPVHANGIHSSNSIEMTVLQSSSACSASRAENEIQELSFADPQKAPAYGLVIELVERQDMPTTSLAKCASPPASQISFIDFYKDGTSHIVPRCIKQKLYIDGAMYVQHEIFGLNELSDAQAGMDKAESMQCAICLSDERDTVILPCRHLCMCRECANTYRQQSNKCPICRTVVETILHIESRDGG